MSPFPCLPGKTLKFSPVSKIEFSMERQLGELLTNLLIYALTGQLLEPLFKKVSLIELQMLNILPWKGEKESDRLSTRITTFSHHARVSRVEERTYILFEYVDNS